MTTGIYPYTHEISTFNGGAWTVLQSTTYRMAIVNRSNSPYGAGWWPAGIEELLNVGGNMMWIGGDGSVREYEFALTSGSNTFWVAPSVNRPDTLVYNSTANNWVRRLYGGATVTFDANGLHSMTTNTAGHLTLFAHDAGTRRLTRILTPPLLSSQIYDWYYSAVTGKLDSVVAPTSSVFGRRVARFTMSSGLLTAILDPSRPVAVSFSYDATPGAENRMITRTDRRGVVNNFAYETIGRLTESWRVASGSDTIRQNFCPAEVAGRGGCAVDPVQPGDVATSYLAPRRTDHTGAALPHTTTYVLDRFGGPTVITDAKGQQTTILKQDSRWPALPTSISFASGLQRTATYDSRGNLATTTDNSFTPFIATTTYAWDQTWDALTEMVKPEGEIVRFGGFSGSQSLPLWREDGRGLSSRVEFRYTAGEKKLRAVVYPGGGHDSLTYDGSGNLSGVGKLRAASKRAWTLIERDNLGRPRVTKTQFDTLWTVAPSSPSQLYQHDSTYFDATGRVVQTVSYGPTYGGVAAQKIRVTQTYDNEDNVLTIERRADPDPDLLGSMMITRTYDDIGRITVETDPANKPDSMTYDKAGNLITKRTRRGHLIEMRYDTLNRLATRIVPPATYLRETKGIGADISPNIAYPRLDDGFAVGAGDTIRVPGDTATFKYDVSGNLTEALNRDGKVVREYLANGLIRKEELWVRKYDLSTPLDDTHKYVTEYVYDMNGRKHAVTYPLIGGGATYWYDTLGTGALKEMSDRIGNPFTFNYDFAGNLTSIARPGSTTETMTYDLDGTLVRNKLTNNTIATPTSWRHSKQLLRLTDFRYDARGKLLRSAVKDTAGIGGTRDTLIATYTALGHLRTRNYVGRGLLPNTLTEERFTSLDTTVFDALGHERFQWTSSSMTVPGTTITRIRFGDMEHDAGTGRLRYQQLPRTQNIDGWDVKRRDTLVYNASGDVEFFTQHMACGLTSWDLCANQSDADLYAPREDRASYYGADGKLRIIDYRLLHIEMAPDSAEKFKYVYEEFRYDALGRRILVRQQRSCFPIEVDPGCPVGVIRRIFWDGTQVHGEVQMPDTPAWRENDASAPSITYSGNLDPHSLFGLVHYAHALGIDQPISIYRTNYVRKPVGESAHFFNPFVITPYWNHRGEAELGSFNQGLRDHCPVVDGVNRCVIIGWPGERRSDRTQMNQVPTFWHGDLLNRKEDGGGTIYMRNRYYDTKTGRFTQEDPLGLAGGLNLYGFADGDPVNLSDPFGTCAFAGAAGSVAMGATLAAATGGEYGAGSAAFDAVTGALCFGAVVKGIKLWRAGKAASRLAAASASGTARVIGSYPQYLQVGEAIGAKVFNVPDNVWKRMSDVEKWAANKKFLDRGISEGAEFVMATHRDDIIPGTMLAREVDYLLRNGYVWSSNGLSLIRR